MKVTSIRVATIEQNTDRQTDVEGITYMDECSGSITFKEPTKAKKLLINKDIKEVHMHSIDRLFKTLLTGVLMLYLLKRVADYCKQ
jgi:hypothetical protein